MICDLVFAMDIEGTWGTSDTTLLLAIQKFASSYISYFEYSSDIFFFQKISIIFTFSLLLIFRTNVYSFAVIWVHGSIAWLHEKEA